MKKVLLSYDKRNHELVLARVNSDVKTLNSLMETIRTESDRIEITKENIQSLIKDPKGFIFDLVVQKDKLNFNGLPISRKKAMDMIDFPEEFSQIISECEKVKVQLSNNTYKIQDYNISRVSIDDLSLQDFELSLTEDYTESLKGEFCRYTSNEKQNIALEQIKMISSSLDELVKIGFITERKLENAELSDLGFKFYDSKKKIDLDQVLRVR